MALAAGSGAVAEGFVSGKDGVALSRAEVVACDVSLLASTSNASYGHSALLLLTHQSECPAEFGGLRCCALQFTLVLTRPSQLHEFKVVLNDFDVVACGPFTSLVLSECGSKGIVFRQGGRRVAVFEIPPPASSGGVIGYSVSCEARGSLSYGSVAECVRPSPGISTIVGTVISVPPDLRTVKFVPRSATSIAAACGAAIVLLALPTGVCTRTISGSTACIIDFDFLDSRNILALSQDSAVSVHRLVAHGDGGQAVIILPPVAEREQARRTAWVLGTALATSEALVSPLPRLGAPLQKDRGVSDTVEKGADGFTDATASGSIRVLATNPLPIFAIVVAAGQDEDIVRLADASSIAPMNKGHSLLQIYGWVDIGCGGKKGRTTSDCGSPSIEDDCIDSGDEGGVSNAGSFTAAGICELLDELRVELACSPIPLPRLALLQQGSASSNVPPLLIARTPQQVSLVELPWLTQIREPRFALPLSAGGKDGGAAGASVFAGPPLLAPTTCVTVFVANTGEAGGTEQLLLGVTAAERDGLAYAVSRVQPRETAGAVGAGDVCGTPEVVMLDRSALNEFMASPSAVARFMVAARELWSRNVGENAVTAAEPSIPEPATGLSRQLQGLLPLFPPLNPDRATVDRVVSSLRAGAAKLAMLNGLLDGFADLRRVAAHSAEMLTRPDSSLLLAEHRRLKERAAALKEETTKLDGRLKRLEVRITKHLVHMQGCLVQHTVLPLLWATQKHVWSSLNDEIIRSESALATRIRADYFEALNPDEITEFLAHLIHGLALVNSSLRPAAST